MSIHYDHGRGRRGSVGAIGLQCPLSLKSHSKQTREEQRRHDLNDRSTRMHMVEQRLRLASHSARGVLVPANEQSTLQSAKIGTQGILLLSRRCEQSARSPSIQGQQNESCLRPNTSHLPQLARHHQHQNITSPAILTRHRYSPPQPAHAIPTEQCERPHSNGDH